MKKIIFSPVFWPVIWLFLTIFLIEAGAQPAEELGYWEYIQNDPICMSVPRLRYQKNGQTKWNGTAVIVGQNYALTAAHCVVDETWHGRRWRRWKEEKTVDVEIQIIGKWVKCKTVKVDKENDIALIRFNTLIKLDPIPIAQDFDPEETFYHIGRAGQSTARHFETHVIDEQQNFTIYSGDVIQGDSGGAILDKNNCLVGIISFGRIHKDRYGNALVLEETGAVSLYRIRRFLEIDTAAGFDILACGINNNAIKKANTFQH